MNKKVIAVIDELEELPERCAKCPLEIDWTYCGITLLDTDEDLQDRPSWCPLREVGDE